MHISTARQPGINSLSVFKSELNAFITYTSPKDNMRLGALIIFYTKLKDT